ncbi:MAG: hypothetical protein AAFY82_00220 [Pseudomonadota bacterium]
MTGSVRPYVSRIETLEEENEHLRQLNEDLRKAAASDEWDQLRWPLTLQQTRVLRLVHKGIYNRTQIARKIELDYPNFNVPTLNVVLTKIRRALPEAISPRRSKVYNSTLRVPDPETLGQYLAGVPLVVLFGCSDSAPSCPRCGPSGPCKYSEPIFELTDKALRAIGAAS